MVMQLSVAPMVDITTRHFRYLLRLMTKRTVLWTPMFASHRLAKLKKREVEKMLRYSPVEHPLVAQVGGDDVAEVLAAAKICQDLGYGEVNLNLGCPSRNAHSGKYGALMMLPANQKRCVAIVKALTTELTVPISCKVRIGVDSYDSYEYFRDFVGELHSTGGCDRFVIHARKALLDGLPPKLAALDAPAPKKAANSGFVSTTMNRSEELVPLRPEFAYRLKKELPALRFQVNGGIKTLEQVRLHHASGADGAMVGRLARDDPFFFAGVDHRLFGDVDVSKGLGAFEARLLVLEAYASYCDKEQKEASKYSPVAREMLLKPTNQLFQGLPLAKQLYGAALRARPEGKRPEFFGDELRQVLDELRLHKSRGALNEVRLNDKSGAAHPATKSAKVWNGQSPAPPQSDPRHNGPQIDPRRNGPKIGRRRVAN
ncbi:hypothetical protein M885DRAFT_512530 [Pelagophyceae sp. CCMP2097]|nr:hypothetical protein M885DRAFT_512530 [Pelagophyceae sp. CCMP2097]